MFKYQGIERLQLCFFSPNVCATFLAITILLSLAIFLTLNMLPERWYKSIILSLVTFAILFQEALFACAYSRGGYIGLALGFFVIWWICRKKSVCYFALSALGIILFTAGGINRVQSIGNIVSDASIGNRLLLWRGATGMIANNPIYGIATPGELYHAWYQPLWLNEHYRTMINDALTLGANYGIWVLFLYYLIFFSLLYFILKYAKIFGRYTDIFAGMAGALTSYFICASFSTMYEHFILDWTIIILLSIASIALTTIFIANKIKFYRYDYIIPVGATVFVTGAIYIWGMIENYHLPYVWEYRQIILKSDKLLPFCRAYPKGDISANVICFIGEQWSNNNYYSNFIREFARPLLKKGYALNIIRTNSGLQEKQNAIKFLNKTIDANVNMPFFIFGIGSGAQNAILASASVKSAKIKKVAVVNPPADWPFEELSPLGFIDKFKGELLLLASEDKLYEANELANKRKNSHLPFELIVFKCDILGKLLKFYGEKVK